LAREGFDVTFLTDENNNSVQANDVFNAVAGIVESGVYDQFVFYFSGHGFWNSYSEYWLLSNAPYNPAEAISLIESVDLARRSGIPNVVFISDACRSTASSLGADGVKGQIVFPNPSSQTAGSSEIDRFFAALPGEPSFEMKVTDSVANFAGIYTLTFLDALQNPPAEIVNTVDGQPVISIRKLKPYLKREVPRRIAARSLKLQQTPDAWLECGDSAYIGRIQLFPMTGFGSPGSSTPVGPGATVGTSACVGTAGTAGTAGISDNSPPPVITPLPTVASIVDVANNALEAVGAGIGSPVSATQEALIKGSEESGFHAKLTDIVKSDRRTHDVNRNTVNRNARTEIILFNATGDIISEVKADNSSLKVKVADGVVQAEGELNRPTTMAMRFGSGLGTVLACLPGYTGSITISNGRVINVSYTPMPTNWRWSDYEGKREQLDRLRATVATAAQYGVFRIEGSSETRGDTARSFADRIRVLKGLDPTLGLYAAYAYNQAGLLEQIKSVADYMRSDLEAQIFDVAMLDGTINGDDVNNGRVVPFCPMLNQGWSLLRVKNVRLREPLEGARDRLVPALWTTFDSEGTSMVFEALRA
jgi:hypothetical protein